MLPVIKLECQNRFSNLRLNILFQLTFYAFSFNFMNSETSMFAIALLLFFIISFTHAMVRKVLLGGQTFEMKVLMDLHGMRLPISKNYIFGVWSVCLFVFYQHNSKTNYNRTIKFSILYLYHVQMLLETFYKDRTKTLCTWLRKEF